MAVPTPVIGGGAGGGLQENLPAPALYNVYSDRVLLLLDAKDSHGAIIVQCRFAATSDRPHGAWMPVGKALPLHYISTTSTAKVYEVSGPDVIAGAALQFKFICGGLVESPPSDTVVVLSTVDGSYRQRSYEEGKCIHASRLVDMNRRIHHLEANTGTDKRLIDRLQVELTEKDVQCRELLRQLQLAQTLAQRPPQQPLPHNPVPVSTSCECSQLKASVEEYKKAIVDLRRTVQHKEKELEMSKVHGDSLEMALEEARQENKKLRDSDQSLRETVLDLTTQISGGTLPIHATGADDTIATVTVTNTTVQHDNETLVALQDALANTTSQMQYYRDLCKELQGGVVAMPDLSFDTLRREHDALKRRSEALEAELAGTRQALESVFGSWDVQLAASDKLTQQQAEFNAAKAQFEEQQRHSNLLVAELRREVDALRRDNASLLEQFGKHVDGGDSYPNKRIEELLQQVATAQRTIAAKEEVRKSRLMSAVTETEGLRGELRQLQRRLEAGVGAGAVTTTPQAVKPHVDSRYVEWKECMQEMCLQELFAGVIGPENVANYVQRYFQLMEMGVRHDEAIATLLQHNARTELDTLYNTQDVPEAVALRSKLLRHRLQEEVLSHCVQPRFEANPATTTRVAEYVASYKSMVQAGFSPVRIVAAIIAHPTDPSSQLTALLGYGML